MVIDGIGLGIITLCTLMEGMDDWQAPLSDYYPENVPSIFFWITGLSLAVGGLIFLIVNAAALEELPDMEHLGMAMLTFAPFINVVAWFLLETRDPFHVYNKQQYVTEVLEFVGMGSLDLSYFCGHNYVLEYVCELTGYLVLACAAMLDVTYLPGKLLIPVIELRTENYHRWDVFGLLLLAIVASGKFYMSKSGCSVPPDPPPALAKPSRASKTVDPKFATQK